MPTTDSELTFREWAASQIAVALAGNPGYGGSPVAAAWRAVFMTDELIRQLAAPPEDKPAHEMSGEELFREMLYFQIGRKKVGPTLSAATTTGAQEAEQKPACFFDVK